MLQNYLKIAWRNITKDKFYTFINISGLALATAAFLFIINYARYEYSYENFYKKADDIYRITLDNYKGKEFVVTDCETHPPLGPAVKKGMPEVVDYVRVEHMEEVPEIKSNGKIFKLDNVYAVDPSMFTIFNYDFIEGNPATAVAAPMQAVLTESLAKRMYGNEPAVGKVFQDGDWTFTVTAVIKDVPSNTHLKFDLLLSLTSLTRRGIDLNSWNANNNYTYVQLVPHANLAAFNQKLVQLSKEKVKDDRFVAEPMKDIHLHSHKSFEPEENGDIKTVQFMLVIAALVLLVGAVNYVNLTTARAADKTKETGMRKALGSSRMSLIKQFMTETILVNALALLLGLLLIYLLLPAYVQLTGRPISTVFFQTSFFWFSAAALFIFNCLLSGLYPALVLSAVKPVSVTRRSFTATSGGVLFRKVLVVGQFAAALIVLSASLIVFRQLSYMRSQDLGINTDQTLILRAPGGQGKIIDSIRRQQSAAFLNNVSQLPQVEKITAAEAIPGVSLHELSATSGISQLGSDKGLNYTFYAYGIDENFLPAMNIKLLAGSNFRAGVPNSDQMILSKEAIRLFGFSSPQEAIGKRLTLSWTSLGYSTVIGVVDDYHQQSLKGAILPMIHWYRTNGGAFYAAKLNTGNLKQTLAKIRSSWQEQYPEYPFEYHFFNELFDQQYKADQQFGKIVQIFSLFTLFLTCLGILGLTAYNITKRSKEIGIRKVLGASVSSIVQLLSRDFVKLVGIAVVIATPLTWYIMNRWLQDYAYRIQIQWWMFAVAGLLTMAIALLTVSIQSVKAALANPVKSLKSE
ncbi:ABC transporter permease [Chitinophaga sp. 22321]|uniref:ABC transporter permease n=1 Tax=Chitinophaga hostae TaxID=2831022 RepID=A0ABS5IYR9_9BACT|nr:ABC transporter permease [Chitinophaga hostae]MBS0028109.1 ABC transporter permease [Chitinophaga hostae]